MNGLDAALARNSWMDRSRSARRAARSAATWWTGSPATTTRFKALVSHAGPFNLENMDTATEELWFPEWEYGGDFWNPKAMASSIACSRRIST